jgi:outer membrane receptor for ferric coprogen and ferric-rhodotorulic acid
LVCCLAVSLRATSQSSAQAPANPSSPAQAQQKLPTVTTTVIVHGEAKDDYLPETVTVGTLDGATLQQAPLSATVVTRDLLTDQVARVLSDVVITATSKSAAFPSIWPPALKSTE